MKRLLFVAACLFALAGSGAAQEPKGAQPPKKVVPAPPKEEAAKRLVEEVETLEAQLQTKKAYIQAAQIALKQAQLTWNQITSEEAKLAIEAAKTQLAIREAEANEVAVKLKHAKRRADEAKKADAGPLPEVLQLRIMLDDAKVKLEAYKAEAVQAKKNIARLEDLAIRGIVDPAEIEAARAKYDVATAAVKSATATVETVEAELKKREKK